MKLLRYGKPVHERAGLQDAAGGIHDLSAHIIDLAGDAPLPEACPAAGSGMPPAFLKGAETLRRPGDAPDMQTTPVQRTAA